jgi:hypothetical protein
MRPGTNETHTLAIGLHEPDLSARAKGVCEMQSIKRAAVHAMHVKLRSGQWPAVPGKIFTSDP